MWNITKYMNLLDRRQYGDWLRKVGLGQVEQSKGEINGSGRDLAFSSECMMQYTDDVLYKLVHLKPIWFY